MRSSTEILVLLIVVFGVLLVNFLIFAFFFKVRESRFSTKYSTSLILQNSMIYACIFFLPNSFLFSQINIVFANYLAKNWIQVTGNFTGEYREFRQNKYEFYVYEYDKKVYKNYKDGPEFVESERLDSKSYPKNYFNHTKPIKVFVNPNNPPESARYVEIFLSKYFYIWIPGLVWQIFSIRSIIISRNHYIFAEEDKRNDTNKPIPRA
jgi:hypothetical protein